MPLTLTVTFERSTFGTQFNTNVSTLPLAINVSATSKSPVVFAEEILSNLIVELILRTGSFITISLSGFGTTKILVKVS